MYDPNTDRTIQVDGMTFLSTEERDAYYAQVVTQTYETMSSNYDLFSSTPEE